MAAFTVTNPRISSGGPSYGTAGVTISPGQALALNDASKIVLADADDATLYKCIGVALTNAQTDEQIVYAGSGVILQGDNLATAFTNIGDYAFVHGTAGSLGLQADMSSGDYIFQVANWWATDRMKINLYDYEGAQK